MKLEVTFTPSGFPDPTRPLLAESADDKATREAYEADLSAQVEAMLVASSGTPVQKQEAYNYAMTLANQHASLFTNPNASQDRWTKILEFLLKFLPMILTMFGI